MFITTYRSPGAAFVQTLINGALDHARQQSAHSNDAEPTLTPRIDLHETETSYIVLANMPGADKASIEVKIEAKRITLQAAQVQAAASNDDNAEQLIHCERSRANYARSFNLPGLVEQDNVQAHFENGVLQVVLPKQASAKTTRVTVQ